MNKNIMAIMLSFIFILTLCNASNINIANKNEFSLEILEQYKNSTKDEKEAIKSKIIQNIFTTIGKSDEIPISQVSTLTIIYSDVVGDKQEDAIFTIKSGSKNTIVVVYEKVNNKYIYSSIVDNFFDIKAIQTMSVGGNNKNLIVIREYADQMIGAFEVATFLRAYIWNENKFSLVLNILEDYRAYWNELWDNNSKDESRWLLIKQEAISKWKNNKQPMIYVKQKQMYQQSSIKNSVEIPQDNDFNTIEEREFSQVYYWSDNWKHFIMNEGIKIKTGEKVAILEDTSLEAFSLIDNNKRYRIKNTDGTIGFIDKSDINISNQKNIN